MPNSTHTNETSIFNTKQVQTEHEKIAALVQILKSWGFFLTPRWKKNATVLFLGQKCYKKLKVKNTIKRFISFIIITCNSTSQYGRSMNESRQWMTSNWRNHLCKIIGIHRQCCMISHSLCNQPIACYDDTAMCDRLIGLTDTSDPRQFRPQTLLQQCWLDILALLLKCSATAMRADILATINRRWH